MRGLSRREFFGGTAGLAAAVALPSGAAPAAAAIRPPGSTRAAVAPVTGASVGLQNYGASGYLKTAQIFDGYVGLPLATTMEKVFMGYQQFPSKPPPKMSELGKVGCQFLVSVKPSRQKSPSQQSALAAFLAMLSRAGLSYRALLYAECNDHDFNAGEWLEYWSYYAPVVQDAGVPCCYDPGCNINSYGKAQTYFPHNPPPDQLWMDYYATSFRGGILLDPIIAMARKAGVPAGIAEWGWSAGQIGFNPMEMPWWTAFCNCLVGLANTNRIPLGAVFYQAAALPGEPGLIAGPNDLRIPGIHEVVNAIQATS
jgi:hypothetical protein